LIYKSNKVKKARLSLLAHGHVMAMRFFLPEALLYHRGGQAVGSGSGRILLKKYC
jgi:hypothetical protein